MTGRVATIGVGIAVVLATALPSRSQQPAPKAGPVRTKPRVDAAELLTRFEHTLGRQKLALELKSLEALVEAKKAEIKRVEAEQRMRELAPTIALLDKLDRPVTLAFPNQTPLEDVLKFLKAATAVPGDSGLPIYVDPLGLQEVEKTLQSPVTLDIENIPVKTALRLILKQLGLAFQVKDGLVTITSEASIDIPLEAEDGP